MSTCEVTTTPYRSWLQPAPFPTCTNTTHAEARQRELVCASCAPLPSNQVYVARPLDRMTDTLTVHRQLFAHGLFHRDRHTSPFARSPLRSFDPRIRSLRGRGGVHTRAHPRERIARSFIVFRSIRTT